MTENIEEAALSRFSRRRVISLDEASPELMEAQPGTVIRLSAAQSDELKEIERGAGGGRFRRLGQDLHEDQPKPAAKA